MSESSLSDERFSPRRRVPSLTPRPPRSSDWSPPCDCSDEGTCRASRRGRLWLRRKPLPSTTPSSPSDRARRRLPPPLPRPPRSESARCRCVVVSVLIFVVFQGSRLNQLLQLSVVGVAKRAFLRMLVVDGRFPLDILWFFTEGCI